MLSESNFFCPGRLGQAVSLYGTGDESKKTAILSRESLVRSVIKIKICGVRIKVKKSHGFLRDSLEKTRRIYPDNKEKESFLSKIEADA